MDPKLKKELAEVKPENLREWLEENAPHLVEVLAPAKPDDDSKPDPEGKPSGGITQEQLEQALEAHGKKVVEEVESKLEERDDDVDQQVRERLGDHTLLTELSQVASDKIAEAERNGLPKKWGNDLRLRYSYSSSGTGDGLRVQESDLKLVEGEGDDRKETTLSPRKVIERRVVEDVKHCASLMEAVPGAQPSIRGFGPSAPDPGNEGGTQPAVRESRFRQHLRETGQLREDAKDDDDKPLSEDDQVGDWVGGGS